MNLPILMYHKIQPPEPNSDLAVSVEAFQDQMACLKRRGFETVSLEQLSRACRDGAALPKRPVVITFDDAYQSVFDYARPVLEAQGFTATVFVVARAIGKDNVWDKGTEVKRDACMDADALKHLAAVGWEIGSHGLNHSNLTRVSDKEISEELVESRSFLGTLFNRPVTVFCYPFGACDQRVRDAAATAGYTTACAISPGTASVTADLMALRRVYVKPSDAISDFKRKISMWYLVYRAWRKR
ncbi:polysaccharide deacetylase family protein [bacterium]|nr:polysaccharide deacetylase family protein [bacterium]